MNVHHYAPLRAPQRNVLNEAFLDTIAALQAAHMDSERSIRFDTMTPVELYKNQRAVEGMIPILSLSYAKLIKALCETGTYDPVSLLDILHPLTDGISYASYSEFRRVEKDMEDDIRVRIAERQAKAGTRLARLAEGRVE